MSEHDEELKKLAVKAAEAEAAINRLRASRLLKEDLTLGVSEALYILQEVRFFLYWVAGNPDQLDEAAQRLIGFLIEDRLYVDFSKKGATDE